MNPKNYKRFGNMMRDRRTVQKKNFVLCCTTEVVSFLAYFTQSLIFIPLWKREGDFLGIPKWISTIRWERNRKENSGRKWRNKRGTPQMMRMKIRKSIKSWRKKESGRRDERERLSSFLLLLLSIHLLCVICSVDNSERLSLSCSSSTSYIHAVPRLFSPFLVTRCFFYL